MSNDIPQPEIAWVHPHAHSTIIQQRDEALQERDELRRHRDKAQADVQDMLNLNLNMQRALDEVHRANEKQQGGLKRRLLEEQRHRGEAEKRLDEYEEVFTRFKRVKTTEPAPKESAPTELPTTEESAPMEPSLPPSDSPESPKLDQCPTPAPPHQAETAMAQAFGPREETDTERMLRRLTGPNPERDAARRRHDETARRIIAKIEAEEAEELKAAEAAKAAGPVQLTYCVSGSSSNVPNEKPSKKPIE